MPNGKIKCDMPGCVSGDLVITLAGTSVCRSCLEKAMPFIVSYFGASACHGEIQANKRAAARETAWNSGVGWVK